MAFIFSKVVNIYKTMNTSVIQPKHRTQERNKVSGPKENKPTDRSKNSSRAGGTKYSQPMQSQHRKATKPY